MKVLLINGSPRVGGNTSIALGEMEKIFQQEGIQVETVQVGNKAIRGCVAVSYTHLVRPGVLLLFHS